jgi:cytochrome c-type biogenesis protein CcmH/NrfG
MRFRYLLIIPCFLLLVVIYVSGSWGIADVKKQKVNASIRLWQNDIDSYSTDNWKIVHWNAKQALNKDPDNPDLLLLMGNAYEWNSFQSDNQSQNEKNSKLALEHYRKAAALRPQWPYTWSSIALLKFKMTEFDQEFQSALSNAMELGPWEPRVQITIAEVGLSAWGKLEYAQRLAIIENIRRGVTVQAQVMLDILKKHGQLRMICYEKSLAADVELYCKSNFGA